MSARKDIARKTVRLLVRKLPKDKETLIKTGDFLEILAHLYKKVRDMRNFLVSPYIPKEKKLEFIDRIAERFSVPSDIREIFEYLVDINGFSLLGEIKRLYDHEVEKIMKTSRGDLFLPSEIDKNTVDEIIAFLEKSTGRELEVDVRYDPEIIGGFVFRTSGLVIDTSVRRQLEDLMVRGG